MLLTHFFFFAHAVQQDDTTYLKAAFNSMDEIGGGSIDKEQMTQGFGTF